MVGLSSFDRGFLQVKVVTPITNFTLTKFKTPHHFKRHPVTVNAVAITAFS